MWFFLQSFVTLLLILTTVSGLPLDTSLHKRLDFDSSSVFDGLANTTWNSFWNQNEVGWNSNNDACTSDLFSYTELWNLAVAGRVITEQGDVAKIYSAIQGIENYQNALGWFSATTNKNDDVYVDDNSQVIWVFLDAFHKTQNQAFLNTAVQVMNNIRGEWVNNGGGVLWDVNSDYIASISTSEAALASIRTYNVTNDWSYVNFSQQCVDWLFNNLQDPKDHLFFDGKELSSGKIHKGKLSYTVGVTISTLVGLAKVIPDSDYLKQAVQLAKAATKKKGPFYNKSGFWNNKLKYNQLLFGGLVDLVNLGLDLDSELESQLVHEINREAQHVYNTHISPSLNSKSSSGNTDLFCSKENSPQNSVLDNASIAQIFYDVSKI